MTAGETVLHDGRVYVLVEVRGDRAVLRRAGEPDRIAAMSLVAPVPRARSIYDGVA